MVNKNDIKLDYSRDSLYSEISLKTLKDRYLTPDEKSPQEAIARVAAAFADDLEHAQRMYDYCSKHWLMFSTPVLANGGTDRGLGISCFGGQVEDRISGITDHWTETTVLSTKGGGTSGGWSDLRTSGKGSKSNGMISFLRVVDSIVLAANQGGTRRGSYASYLSVDHPEIEEFLDVRDPSGDHSRRALGIGFHHGVVISDAFMMAALTDQPWNLIDPNSKEVVKTVKARDIWQKIINTRRKTGEPYLWFVDTVNRFFPENLKALGLSNKHSNLCSEIALHSGLDYDGKNRTFICCLSSVNHARFDEWEQDAEQMYADLVRFLDNVVSDFIIKAPASLHQAVLSAVKTRDLGVGAMGFHTYLQSKMIPYESQEALDVHNKLFFLHNKYCIKASEELGAEKGYYPDAYVNGELRHRQRNAHVIAVAPNASSGIICGNVSPGGEPLLQNAFKQTTLSGSFFTKNPILAEYLDSIGKNTFEVWNSIVEMDGTVQHLDFIPDRIKLVFKTAWEMDQLWIIRQAAETQPYICQGRSLNLYYGSDITIDEISRHHGLAWAWGVKGLYYMKGKAQKASQKVTAVKSTETVQDDGSCLACEG